MADSEIPMFTLHENEHEIIIKFCERFLFEKNIRSVFAFDQNCLCANFDIQRPIQWIILKIGQQKEIINSDMLVLYG